MWMYAEEGGGGERELTAPPTAPAPEHAETLSLQRHQAPHCLQEGPQLLRPLASTNPHQGWQGGNLGREFWGCPANHAHKMSCDWPAGSSLPHMTDARRTPKPDPGFGVAATTASESAGALELGTKSTLGPSANPSLPASCLAASLIRSACLRRAPKRHQISKPLSPRSVRDSVTSYASCVPTVYVTANSLRHLIRLGCTYRRGHHRIICFVMSFEPAEPAVTGSRSPIIGCFFCLDTGLDIREPGSHASDALGTAARFQIDSREVKHVIVFR